MKTISKIAKIFDVLAIVYFVYMCIITLISAGIMLFVDAGAARTIAFDNITFTLAPYAGISLGSIKTIGFVTYFTTLLFGAANFVLIRKILKPIKNENVFDLSICKSLRQLGIVTLVSGAVKTAIGFFSQQAIYSGTRYGEIFINDYITGCTVKYNFDLTFIVTAVVIFALSYVFLHGAKLHSKANEIQNNEEISLS